VTYRAWICEGCKRGQVFRDNVWDCPGCCRPCCVGKTEGDLWAAAQAKGWELSAPDEPNRTAVR
jgi:hypothetical protein